MEYNSLIGGIALMILLLAFVYYYDEY
jgi:hypothetical protein